jgi:hemerythrin-like domain-containing protein
MSTTMNFTNRISRTLHEEHLATVALMDRLEQLIARHRHGPPDIGDRIVLQLLSDLSNAVEGEIQRHFAFEEEHLFPYLGAIGEAEIGAHLTDEHVAIQPIGLRIAVLAREAPVRGFDEASWDEFRRSGRELCERLRDHVQKEEMALLPLIEDSMDADTVTRLLQDYLQAA